MNGRAGERIQAMPMATSRFSWSLLLAGGLHGALLAGLWRRPAPGFVPAPAEPALFEVDVREAEPAGPDRRGEAGPGHQSEGTTPGQVAPVAGGASPAPRQGPLRRDDDEPREGLVLPSPGAQGAAPGSRPDEGAGVPSPFASARPAVRFSLTPEEAARALASADRSPGVDLRENRGLERRIEARLRDHRLDHDRKAGVGVGGEVAAALQRSMLTPAAPQEGEATLVAHLDRAGRLLRVEVASSSGEHERWETVGKQAQAALGGRVLRAGQSGGGTRVKLHVRARYQLPSGSKEKVRVKLPFRRPTGAPPPSPSAGQPINPHSHGAPPSFDHREWWGGLNLPEIRALDLIGELAVGVGFDPADIGAKQQRTVSVVVLDETPE